jgi:Ser/Thr protein kinase RdoA (MazF antagonist)
MKPLSAPSVSRLCREIFGIESVAIKELESYYDQNFYIKDKSGKEYVFKASHEHQSSLEFQNAMMVHLLKKKLPVPRVIPSIQNKLITPVRDSFVRLLTFMPGHSVVSDDYSKELLENVGKLAAKTDKALQDFSHLACHRPNYVWDLQNALLLKKYLQSITDDSKRKAVNEILDQYATVVVPVQDSLNKGITHNDITEFNTLSTDGKTISGLIDFGDAAYTHYVNNLATTLAHFMLRQKNPLLKASYIYKAYTKIRSIGETEKQILPILIRTRLATLITMSSDMIKNGKANDYITELGGTAWDALNHLMQFSISQILSKLED